MLANENFDDSRARRLFPREEDDSYLYFGGYQPIVDDFGSVLVQVDDNDYQGDTRVLLIKDGRYGFLNFGWGSCSGCDALQACDSYADVQKLIENLESGIVWFDTLPEAKAYIASPDRNESYFWHEDEWKTFVEKVEAYEPA